MDERVDLSAIENRFLGKLLQRLEGYFEELVYYTPRAGEDFVRIFRKIIGVYNKLNSPGTSRYVDMEGLEDYILEYFYHNHMAVTRRNGYLYTQIRLDTRSRRGIETGEREKKRLREREKEYIEDMKKYSLNLLYMKLERLYERVVELGENKASDGNILKIE